jgi:hypothetical protein
MVRESERPATGKTQNDPGESNDPKTNAGEFNAHIWSSLNQIFERLGSMDQKLTQLTTEQGKLKDTVEKHDRLIVRAIFSVGGAIAILVALWFLYENVLKGHLTFK